MTRASTETNSPHPGQISHGGCFEEWQPKKSEERGKTAPKTETTNITVNFVKIRLKYISISVYMYHGYLRKNSQLSFTFLFAFGIITTHPNCNQRRSSVFFLFFSFSISILCVCVYIHFARDNSKFVAISSFVVIEKDVFE